MPPHLEQFQQFSSHKFTAGLYNRPFEQAACMMIQVYHICEVLCLVNQIRTPAVPKLGLAVRVAAFMQATHQASSASEAAAMETVQASPPSWQVPKLTQWQEGSMSGALSEFVYQPPCLLMDWRLIYGLSPQACFSILNNTFIGWCLACM
jgi:hypothetical protein